LERETLDKMRVTVERVGLQRHEKKELPGGVLGRRRKEQTKSVLLDSEGRRAPHR